LPWHTPDLKQVRISVRDQVRANLEGADANIPNSILRVLADVSGALCHLVLQYLDWLAKQLLPDTAEQEWLERHANLWLKNLDGTTGKKLATLAKGEIGLTGIAWTPVPSGTRFTGDTGRDYETTEQVFLAAGGQVTPAPTRALDPGIGGNLEPGAGMALTSNVPGLDPVAIVLIMDGGVEEESEDHLRARVLLRIREPPMGGAATDYEQWALAVPGVTRAWCYAMEMGIGTCTVRFMMDELRADEEGFPHQSDVDMVAAHIDTVRPVTVKDMFVVSPIRHPVHVEILNLFPDNLSTQAAINANLKAMILERAVPGQPIYAAWKNFAIMSAPGVVSFSLSNSGDDIMPSPGHMPVMGNIIYDRTEGALPGSPVPPWPEDPGGGYPGAPVGRPGPPGPAGPPGPRGPGVIITDDVPAAASPGDLWLDSVSGQMYVRYQDPNSGQWIVTVNPSGGGGGSSSQGAE
jgi:uncharacterized phage protein gp47/JayE